MAWLWYLVAAIWALDALRMRARLKAIPALPPAEAPPTKTFHAISAGAEVDERTRTDGAAYAVREDIALLDLIPSDTPVLHAMGIVQILDPIAYRRNPIAKGHSTGYALLAEDELLVRAGVLPEQPTDVSGLSPSTAPRSSSRRRCARRPATRWSAGPRSRQSSDVRAGSCWRFRASRWRCSRSGCTPRRRRRCSRLRSSISSRSWCSPACRFARAISG
jgi:hypothetical protein